MKWTWQRGTSVYVLCTCGRVVQCQTCNHEVPGSNLTHGCCVKGKADDLYHGSMQFENHRRTALQYPLFIGPYATANNMALLAWRPSQGTKLYCLVNRGTLGVNNLPRVVARIMPRSESNPQPLDHESNAIPLHYRVTCVPMPTQCAIHTGSVNE